MHEEPPPHHTTPHHITPVGVFQSWAHLILHFGGTPILSHFLFKLHLPSPLIYCFICFKRKRLRLALHSLVSCLCFPKVGSGFFFWSFPSRPGGLGKRPRHQMQQIKNRVNLRWVPALCQVLSGMLFASSFTLQSKLPEANILHILQMWKLKFTNVK